MSEPTGDINTAGAYCAPILAFRRKSLTSNSVNPLHTYKYCGFAIPCVINHSVKFHFGLDPTCKPPVIFTLLCGFPNFKAPHLSLKPRTTRARHPCADQNSELELAGGFTLYAYSIPELLNMSSK
jgi:hypothetical protein